MLAALAEMKDVAVLEPMVSIRSAVSEETATKLNELAGCTGCARIGKSCLYEYDKMNSLRLYEQY